MPRRATSREWPFMRAAVAVSERDTHVASCGRRVSGVRTQRVSTFSFLLRATVNARCN